MKYVTILGGFPIVDFITLVLVMMDLIFRVPTDQNTSRYSDDDFTSIKFV